MSPFSIAMLVYQSVCEFWKPIDRYDAGLF